MTIEITVIDVICRIIAAVSVFLTVVLFFYERYKMEKWLKENPKDKEGGAEWLMAGEQNNVT